MESKKQDIFTLQEGSKLFASKPEIKAADEMLSRKSLRRISFYGLAGSASAVMLSALKPRREPALIIANDFEEAGYIYNDLVNLSDAETAVIFTSAYKRDIKYGQIDSASQILRSESLQAINDSTKLRWIVTYPEALAEKVPSPENISDSTIKLKTGEKILQTDLRDRLLKAGFNKVDYVYEPGQFSIRGSIVDVFSFNRELPVRLDFFDDEIDSIRSFNVETQLSETKMDFVSISYAPEEKEDGISLLEYVNDKTLVFATNPDYCCTRIEEISKTKISTSVELSGDGDVAAMNNIVDAKSFRKAFNQRRIITLKKGLENDEAFVVDKNNIAQASIDFKCIPQSLYHKNFELISESFNDFIRKGFKIYLLTDSQYQAERLRNIFIDRGDDISFATMLPTLHEGFADKGGKICYFTDHQIFDRFHKYSLKSDKARSGKLALTLKELGQIETGDYIVHIDHGIGRFGGLVKTDVNGRPQEMIKLLYQNDDIILVSIHALHKLSKYRAKEGVPPKINKLGTGAWNRLKDRTKNKVKDIARDLINLYATRCREQGFAFSPDSYMQHELEASFIYEDTPDQLLATRSIKNDMESRRPMDRLICGDVGFGKTELAVRAAFKAAADNKQTAVLVPTTVLAMQHYQTFTKRLQDFPVRVEFLSRARKPKEVKSILSDLAEGKIDILIGTHKLIGKTVKFKDLGLLIIDEEQKFGVAVKEKLKQLKVNVDTLTMSATPIPRTLQFSLMGARDLSSLNTPPANRHPVVTQLASFDEDLVKEAINFEVSRNGQVFFISNRIERLHQIYDKLHRIVPGVKVVTAHGQMPPEELEKAIIAFQQHDYDVLLSTTIVENGIDMPNVNTILVDNAQNFGLSELHQLRGRVGRSSRKAFCYLLTPTGKPLTPVARRRLQAIESFSDLGSGIHIAMQDLDIRGAGNLLGSEQSGFIADLGYETYQKILREAVIELKAEEFSDKFEEVSKAEEGVYISDCTIESDLELRLPPWYVPSESERIALYQQLDNMTKEEETVIYRRDLRDRFGEIPEVSEELIKVVPMRLEAIKLGIERLVLKSGKMRLYFVGDENKAYYQSDAFGKVISYIQQNPLRCQIREANGKRSIVIDNIGSISEALSTLRSMK